MNYNFPYIWWMEFYDKNFLFMDVNPGFQHI